MATPHRIEPQEADLIVFDMASLRFARQGEFGPVSVRTANGEVLATALDAPAHLRSAALAALDAAAETARVWQNGRLHRVALYNPYTSEVAVGPSLDCQVFTAGEPLVIDSNGETAVMHDGVTELSDGTVLHEVAPTDLTAVLKSRLRAHRY